MGKYDSIIRLPHHVSEKHPQMSPEKRAAQFQSFMALSGFTGAIAETGRLTESRKDPGSDLLQMLEGKLSILRAESAEQAHPEVTVTYFRPDEKKKGGAYLCITGKIKKIDGINRILIMDDGTKIAAGQILDLQIQADIPE